MNRDFRFKPIKKMEIKDMLDWCYWVGEKPTDYIMTEWLFDALPKLYKQDEKIYQYNQYKENRSKKSCTIFSAVWWVSDLMNYQFDYWEIKEIDEESYNQWRRKGEWWWVLSAVELVQDWWNKTKKDKIAFYQVSVKDNQLLKKILNDRYTVCTGYNGNSTYNNDKNDNGVLNKKEFWKSTYGHAISTIWSVNNNPLRIKDNYEGTKYNIYDVANNLSDISCFFEYGYLYTKVSEDNMERLKELNEFRTILVRSIADNSAMRHLTNDKNYRKELNEMNNINRKKLQDIDIQVAKLS